MDVLVNVAGFGLLTTALLLSLYDDQRSNAGFGLCCAFAVWGIGGRFVGSEMPYAVELGGFLCGGVIILTLLIRGARNGVG